MWANRILLAVAFGAGTAADSAAAQGARPPGESGVVVVRLVMEPAVSAGPFHFRGTPAGATTTGGSLLATGLRPGTYTTTLIDPGPGVRLVAITCDDPGSAGVSEGDVAARTGRFNVGPGETVACVFTLSPVGASREVSSATAVANPFESPEVLEGFPVPADLPPSAGTFQFPRSGQWEARNNAGEMACTAYAIPLPAVREAGTLDVLSNRTIRGTGFGQAAPFVMTSDPDVTGRYTGTATAFQGLIAVPVSLVWQLVTDERIIGYLRSELTDEACAMHQTFELIYVGG